MKRAGIRQLSCLPELCIVQEKDKKFLDNALNHTLSSEQITQVIIIILSILFLRFLCRLKLY